jgi:hypothetical protein
MTGAWAGAGLALVSFALLRRVAERIEAGRADLQHKRSAALIRVAAFIDLVLLPVVGYVLGPMVLRG